MPLVCHLIAGHVLDQKAPTDVAGIPVDTDRLPACAALFA